MSYFQKVKRSMFNYLASMTPLPELIYTLSADGTYYIIGTGFTSVEDINSNTGTATDGSGYNSGAGELIIPTHHNGLPVKGIAPNAFKGITAITGLTITSGQMITLGEFSFQNCTNITTLALPSGLTTINHSAFSGCTGLRSIIIPSSVTTIGESPFALCSGITSITVESGNAIYDSRNNCNAIIETSTNKLIQGCVNSTIFSGVTEIGTYAFGHSNIRSVIIPASVTVIGWDAFSQCRMLSSVTFESNSQCTDIQTYAFYYCDSLTSITIPDSVTDLGLYVLSYCTQLTSVTIGSGITTIPIEGFKNDTNLSSIVLPSSITKISNKAYQNISNLSTIYCYSDNITSLPTAGSSNGAFYNKLTRTVTIHVKSTNTGLINYDWSSDNITATIVQDL